MDNFASFNPMLLLADRHYAIAALAGCAKISEPYIFTAEIIANANRFNACEHILQPAVIKTGKRQIAGIITECQQTITDEHGKSKIHIIIEPQIALAGLTKNPRIVFNQTVPEIIMDILMKHGYDKSQIQFHLSKNYVKPSSRSLTARSNDDERLQNNLRKSYRLQVPNETDLDFLQRLLSAEKIFYWIDTEQNGNVIREIIHLSDDNQFHFDSVIPASDFPQFPTILQAHITASGNSHLHYRLDPANSAESPPIPKLSPYGDGWQMPLHHKAEVLVSAINGDPDQPIIIGTAPNVEKVSPVTVANKQQNIIRTTGGNQIIMDDTIDKQKILITTANQQNLLELNSEKNNQKINLTSKQGAIEWLAKQTIHLHNKDTVTENIGGNKTNQAKQNIKIQTSQQNIHHQTDTDYIVNAKNSIAMEAKGNIEFSVAKNLNIAAKQNVQLTVNGDNALFNVQAGSFFIQAREINITGSGNGDIEIMQNDAGFKITKTGNVEIFGNCVNFQAEQGIDIIGKVNYTSIAADAKLATPPQSRPPQEIPNITQPITKTKNNNFHDEFAGLINSNVENFHDLLFNGIQKNVYNKNKYPRNKLRNIKK